VIGVGNGSGREDDQSRILRIDALHALAVEWPGAGGSAGGQAHGDRDRHAGAVEVRGRLVDDLVEGDRREIRELHFHDGTHALDCRAHRQADHRVLGDRAVEHPVGKHFREALGGLEGTAESGDVLSIEKHARVFPQQGFLRLADGIDVGHAHGKTAWLGG